MNSGERRCLDHKAESYYGFCYKENKLMCQLCSTKNHILHFDKHINFYLVHKRELKQLKNILNADGPAYDRQLAVLDFNKQLSTEQIIQHYAEINNNYQHDLQNNLDALFKESTQQFQRITNKMQGQLIQQLGQVGTIKQLDEEFNQIFNVIKLQENALEGLNDQKLEISKWEEKYTQGVKEFQKIDQNKCSKFDLKMKKVKQISDVNLFNQQQIRTHYRTFLQQNLQQCKNQSQYLEQYIDVGISNMKGVLEEIK